MTERSGRHRTTAPFDTTRPAPTGPKRPSPADGEAVSSAANGSADRMPQTRQTSSSRGVGHAHELVAVGPGLPLSGLSEGGHLVSELPVQPARIHCPPPRDDTLSRERLNAWLERATAGRLALIVAEAGFGKTTLLADWAMGTRRMTAWYRLEPDDRDWLTFIRHIVASGREIEPGFAPETFRLLQALESGGTTQHELTVALAREVSGLRDRQRPRPDADPRRLPRRRWLRGDGTDRPRPPRSDRAWLLDGHRHAGQSDALDRAAPGPRRGHDPRREGPLLRRR